MLNLRPRRLFKRIVLLGASLLFPVVVLAQATSPVGLWRNIDDKTGKPRALVRVTEAQGTLQGRIERVFPAPGESPDPKCVKCEGANRNAPVVGLLIMTELRKTGDEYADGQILDPDSGSTYRSRVRLLENGQKLSVRGYIGIPALGRTQVWIREE